MSDLNVSKKVAAPICCHLRSNGMYVHGTTDEIADALPGCGDGSFWCLKTMHLFGPDNEDANRQACQPGRACYETV